MRSTKKFRCMLLIDLTEPEFPFKLNNLLPLLQLQVSPLLMNARAILYEISKAGRVKATPAGNLTRKTTFALFNRCIVPEKYREIFVNEKGPLNEEMISFVHKPRVLLQLANLLRKKRGYFYVTKKGKEMIREASAGELYALLFDIHFSRFNLGYLDTLPELYEFQASISFSLYKIWESSNDWLARNKVEDSIMLPSVGSLVRIKYPKRDFSFRILYHRLLVPLQEFGLIEVLYESEKNYWDEVKGIRKTSLFNMFLAFDLSKKNRENVAEDISSYGFQNN